MFIAGTKRKTAVPRGAIRVALKELLGWSRLISRWVSPPEAPLDSGAGMFGLVWVIGRTANEGFVS